MNQTSINQILLQAKRSIDSTLLATCLGHLDRKLFYTKKKPQIPNPRLPLPQFAGTHFLLRSLHPTSSVDAVFSFVLHRRRCVLICCSQLLHHFHCTRHPKSRCFRQSVVGIVGSSLVLSVGTDYLIDGTIGAHVDL